MKHFVIEITYTSPLEEVEKVVKEHREFLDIAYKNNIILFSGPKNPRRGGIIIAKGIDEDTVKEYFSNDPFQKKKVAEYRFIEFLPFHFHPILKDWIETTTL